MHVLIAGPDSLGEVVCSTALVRCLKEQMPGIRLYYWVWPHLADCLLYNPYIDQLIPLAEEPFLLPPIHFHYLIDLRSSRPLRQWAKSAGISYLSCNPSFLVSFLSEHFGLYKVANLLMPERYFDAVKSLGVYSDNNGLDYFLSTADEIAQQDIPLAQSAGYLALVVGEHEYDKPIPLRLLEAFCRRLQHPLVLVNSWGNCEEAKALYKTDPVKIYNACGKFSLNETADLLRRSKLVLTPESSLMQVAVAFRKPLIVWRSATAPSPFFPPYYPAVKRNQLGDPSYAGWHWPPADMTMLRSTNRATGALNKVEEVWVQQGLKLVNSFLSKSRNLQ